MALLVCSYELCVCARLNSVFVVVAVLVCTSGEVCGYVDVFG